MAKGNSNHYVFAPEKIEKKALQYTLRVLEALGKPFYFIISRAVFFVLYICYIVGNSTKKIIFTLISPKIWVKLANSLHRKTKFITLKSKKTLFNCCERFPKTTTHYENTARSKYKTFTSGLPTNKHISNKKIKYYTYSHSAFTKSVHRYVNIPSKTLPASKKALKILTILRVRIKRYAKSARRSFRKEVSQASESTFAYYHQLKLVLLRIRLKFAYSKTKSHRVQKPHILRPRYRVYIITILILLFPIVASFTFWQIFLIDLPSTNELRTREIPVSTKIYDRNGVLLYKIFKDENRTPVDLEDIPESVIFATLAIEDSDFYSHPGFSVKGMARAFITNIHDGKLTGGSTITQQLVKNTLLSSEKTLTRKVREVVLAVQVENTFNKDEILEMYLNEVSYGGTSYGIQEASQYYFGKNVSDITLAEAALLAGLPKSPSANSPFGKNPENGLVRQRHVLEQMKENGYISESQRRIAEQDIIKFTDNKTGIKAPHFVMYVKDELEKKYGSDLVEKGGLSVITTLDWKIQQLTDAVVQEEIETLSGLNVGNGAAVVMDPTTGEILAMTGSKDYFDVDSDGNVNVTTALRQPGSSIKVINYAYALANGMTPATIVSDSPVSFSVQGQPPYSPKNYDGSFRGNLSLRSALAESRNVPAVKILNQYGVTNMIALGKRMGITSWANPSRFGLSLTLGGGEVRLIDMAQVYATLANYGKRPSITPIRSIATYRGIVIENRFNDIPTPALAKGIFSVSAKSSISKTKASLEGEQILDPRVAFIITDILKDNSARTPAFGRNSLLNVKGHPEVAVKTGTSNDLKDNLAIGYTNDYVVAVWVGNNDSTPMSRIASGITGATPIYNKIMTALLTGSENDTWEIPDGLIRKDICSATGTLPCGGCPSKAEWFLEENQPQNRCSVNLFKKADSERGFNNPDQRKEDLVF